MAALPTVPTVAVPSSAARRPALPAPRHRRPAANARAFAGGFRRRDQISRSRQLSRAMPSRADHMWTLAEECYGGLWEAVELPPPPPTRYNLLGTYMDLAESMSVTTDGLSLAGVNLSPEDIYGTILPLREWVRQLRRQAKGSERTLIGISGPGGSGKTTLAAILAAVLNSEEDGSCCVLGQDGYHYKTEHLQSTEVINPYTGDTVPLSTIKGTPPSFDVEAFVADLRRCATGSPSETISLPQYDRSLHEPVDGRVTVGPKTEVVLVEGLFLLDDSEGWAELRPMMHGTVALDIPKQECQARQRRRQVAAGRTETAIQANFDRVDGPNHDRISTCTHRADLVLQPVASGFGEFQFCVEQPPEGSSREAKLLAIGLNPALQKAMWFSKLTTGAVNRAQKTALSVGGKGQGCAKAATACAPGATAVAQFLGGNNGTFISESLADLGFSQVNEWVEGETRVCTTLLCQDTNTATEIIDPSAEISTEEAEALMSSICQKVQDYLCVTICGTFPPGVDESFYASVVGACKDSTTVVLDSYKGVGQALATGRVDVLKINKDEVLEITGCETLEEGASKCLRELLGNAGSSLAVTDGSRPAELFSAGTRHTFEMPPNLKVVNPIGAGDTCTGVMSYYLMWGLPVAEAFRWGLAAACASCLQEGGAVFSMREMHALHEQIGVEVCTWEG